MSTVVPNGSGLATPPPLAPSPPHLDSYTRVLHWPEDGDPLGWTQDCSDFSIGIWLFRRSNHWARSHQRSESLFMAFSHNLSLDMYLFAIAKSSDMKKWSRDENLLVLIFRKIGQEQNSKFTFYIDIEFSRLKQTQGENTSTGDCVHL